MPQAQQMQLDPVPRPVEALLEDGVIGGILNLELEPPIPDDL